MARKQVTYSPTENDEAIDVTFEDRTQQAADEADELEDFKAAFGQDSDSASFHGKIYKIVPESNKRPYLFSCQRTDLAKIHENVLARYGSGDYEARIIKTENGRATIHKRIMFSVIAPNVAFAASPSGSGDTATVVAIQALTQTIQNMQNAEASRPAPVTPQRMSPTELAALITAGAGALSILKDVFKTPASNNGNPMEMITSVIDLVRNANDDGREKGVMDLVSDVLKSDLLPKFLETMPRQPIQQIQTNPLPRVAQQITPMQPIRVSPTNTIEIDGSGKGGSNTGTVVAEHVQSVQPDNTNAYVNAIKQNLAYLVDRAAKDKDPQLYADLLLDTEEVQPLLPMLIQPGIITQLIEYEPRIAQYQNWFLELLEHVKEGLTFMSIPVNEPANQDAGIVSQPSAADENVQHS